MRSAVAARHFTLRVPTQRILPPLMSLSGHNSIQEANAEALRNFVKSGPISPNSVWAMPVRIPGIFVRSTPNTLGSSLRSTLSSEGGLAFLSARIANQRFGDHFLARFDALVAWSGEPGGITFSRQNGVHDRQSGLAGDVADYVMQLQIHLVQRFLHVVDVGRGHLHQAFPMPQQRTHGANLLFGTIGGAQQSDRMQELQPLAVRYVSPSARHILYVPRIHQTDLELAVLQNLEQRNPVDPGRFHRDRGDRIRGWFLE